MSVPSRTIKFIRTQVGRAAKRKPKHITLPVINPFASAMASDLEQALEDIANALGCEPDNEKIMEKISELKGECKECCGLGFVGRPCPKCGGDF